MPLGAARLNTLGKAQAEAGRSSVSATTVGNTQIDTAQSKFGGASVIFDGSGDRLDLATGTISGNFTIEFFIRWNNLSSNFQYPISNRGGGGSGRLWLENRNTDDLRISWDNGDNALKTHDLTNVISTNTWYHYTIMVKGDTLYFFIDGVSKLTGNADWNGAILNNNSSGNMYLGGATFGQNWNGHIDEFRLSDTDRYSTSGFTTPSTAFINDANTIALFHMDGTDGSTTFTDDAS